MKSVVLLPWIGSRYRSVKTRLLIVGESHYGEPDEVISRSTSTVVDKWKSGEWSIRYLVAAGRLVSGLSAWELDRDTVLEEVAWYNFVQVGMETLSHRPTALHLKEATGAFLEVIADLDPTHIIVTGVLVWRNLPPFIDGTREVLLDDKQLEVGEYVTPSGRAVAIGIPHLSRGFSPPVWHGVVREFLLPGRP